MAKTTMKLRDQICDEPQNLPALSANGSSRFVDEAAMALRAEQIPEIATVYRRASTNRRTKAEATPPGRGSQRRQLTQAILIFDHLRGGDAVAIAEVGGAASRNRAGPRYPACSVCYASAARPPLPLPPTACGSRIYRRRPGFEACSIIVFFQWFDGRLCDKLSACSFLPPQARA